MLMRTTALVALVALSCHSSTAAEARVGQEFQLKVGQAAYVANTDLTLQFDKVTEDSRCPMGVLCIQAGNGAVQIVAIGISKRDTLVLNTTHEPTSGVTGTWRVTLKELDPFRQIGHDIQPGDYVVTLSVSKAQ